MRRSLRWTAIVVALLLGLPLVLFGALRLQWELGGEVVTVRALDEEGRAHETRLWVVDDAGTAFLRTGNPETAWLQRLLRRPEIEVTRGGETAPFRAVVERDPELRDRVNDLVAAKYGLAERTLRFLFLDPARAQVVRLDPLEP
jgi:hypothetical protein